MKTVESEMIEMMSKERTVLYDYIESLKCMLELADDKMETMQKLIDALEEKSTIIDSKQVCDVCNGSGISIKFSDGCLTVMGRCYKCNGKGVVPHVRPVFPERETC